MCSSLFYYGWLGGSIAWGILIPHSFFPQVIHLSSFLAAYTVASASLGRVAMPFDGQAVFLNQPGVEGREGVQGSLYGSFRSLGGFEVRNQLLCIHVGSFHFIGKALKLN